MTGKFVPIEFEPGINKNTTNYNNEARWVDGDKVRFRKGKPEKLGGWNKQTSFAFTGVARDIATWADLTSEKILAVGTNKKVQMFYQGLWYDVTPVRVDSTGNNILYTTNGSSTVRINIASHGCFVGDFIRITNTPTVGGLTLGGQYMVTSVVDVNNFTIEASSNATSTVSGGGGTCDYELLLQNGPEFNRVARGWGAGTWGMSTWGTPRTVSNLVAELRQWSFDSWGEDLVACPRGGRIYVWDRTNGFNTPLALINNSPAKNNFVFVSYPARHMVSLGCTSETGVFDPMLVRWSSSENYNDWVSTPANSAGSQRMTHGNVIMGAEASRRETLIFTDEATYIMNYLGATKGVFFGFSLLGTGSGLVSQHASANINGVVYWWSNNNFYMYDGALKTLNCTIQQALSDPEDDISLNLAQKEMVFCGVNQEYNEIIWFYPARGSNKCNRYVIHNYLENLWYDGYMERSVWEDSNIFDKPFACSNDSFLYVHEQGYNDEGNPMNSFIKSGTFDIAEGDSMMFVDKFVPDFQQEGNLDVTFRTKKYPQSGEIIEKTYTVAPNTGMINVRLRGRHTSLEIRSNTTNGQYNIGKPRIAIQQDGTR